MYRAELGDDVFGEDPTVNRLEEMAAERLGKEAGLLVSSGTKGNLVGILTHTQRGDEVIAGDASHILLYEVAGAAALGGLQIRGRPGRAAAMLDLAAVRATIRGENVHYPQDRADLRREHAQPARRRRARRRRRCSRSPTSRTASTSRSTSTGRASSTPRSRTACRSPTWSAAPTRSRSASRRGCPARSARCSAAATSSSRRARKYRKMVGGGMRQAGIIAAAGVVALNEMVDRLAEDHAERAHPGRGAGRAARRSRSTSRPVQTNILIFRVRPEAMSADDFVGRAGGRGRALRVDRRQQDPHGHPLRHLGRRRPGGRARRRAGPARAGAALGSCPATSSWSGSWARARAASAGRWPSGSGRPFVDTDERAGRPLRDLDRRVLPPARRGGVPRGREPTAVAEACRGRDQVVSLGGGAIVRPANLAAARDGNLLVYLKASPETIWQRLTASPGAEERPMLAGDDPKARIAGLLAEREPIYAQADLTVETDARTVDQVVDEIARQRRGARARCSVGNGLAARIGPLLRELGLEGRAFVDQRRQRLPAPRPAARGQPGRGRLPAGRAGRARRRGEQVARGRDRAVRLAGRPSGPSGATSSSRWAAAWSATSAASWPRPTCAACRSCRCRRRCWRRSTARSAARRPSTSTSARTWSAPGTCRAWSSSTRRCSATLPRAQVVSGWAETLKHALIMDERLLERIEASAEALLRLEPERHGRGRRAQRAAQGRGRGRGPARAGARGSS